VVTETSLGIKVSEQNSTQNSAALGRGDGRESLVVLFAGLAGVMMVVMAAL
jgi:hypothetical protein